MLVIFFFVCLFVLILGVKTVAEAFPIFPKSQLTLYEIMSWLGENLYSLDKRD